MKPELLLESDPHKYINTRRNQFQLNCLWTMMEDSYEDIIFITIHGISINSWRVNNSIIYICIYMGGCACEPFQWGLIHCNLWQTNHKPLTCLLKGFIYCNDASGKFISVYSNNSPTFYTFNVTCIYFHIIHRHDLIRFGTSKIFSLKKVRNFFGFTFFVLFLILIVLN